jgi:3'(2'), 5'-bisphosphate nucleotidase
MRIYGAEDFEVRAKSDASPVTEADEAADALISAGLRAAFPISRW